MHGRHASADSQKIPLERTKFEKPIIYTQVKQLEYHTLLSYNSDPQAMLTKSISTNNNNSGNSMYP